MAFAYIDRSNNAGWTDHGKGLAQKLVSLINANEHYLSDRDATLDRDALNQAVRGREYVAYPDPITVVNCLSDHEAVEYIATHYKISRESLVSNCERKKIPLLSFLYPLDAWSKADRAESQEAGDSETSWLDDANEARPHSKEWLNEHIAEAVKSKKLKPDQLCAGVSVVLVEAERLDDSFNHMNMSGTYEQLREFLRRFTVLRPYLSGEIGTFRDRLTKIRTNHGKQMREPAIIAILGKGNLDLPRIFDRDRD